MSGKKSSLFLFQWGLNWTKLFTHIARHTKTMKATTKSSCKAILLRYKGLPVVGGTDAVVLARTSQADCPGC